MSRYLAPGTADQQAIGASRRADDGVWPTVRVLYRTLSRGIAQLGSALRSGRRGRGFKSPYPDKLSWSEWAGISTFRAHHATGETDFERTLQQQLVHRPPPHRIQVIVEQIRIRIQGHRGQRVPQPPLDGLHVRPALDHQAGRRVS